MNEGIFRKKSLDRIKSPETLDEYIRVSNPGIWLLLVSVLIILAGACVWGFRGYINSSFPVSVRVENGKAVTYVGEDELSSVQTGLTVTFAETEAVISQIGGKEEPGYVCLLSSDGDLTLPDGFYEGRIIVNRYHPVSFILN